MNQFQNFLGQIGAALARPPGTNWATHSKRQNSVNAFVFLSLLLTVTVGFAEPVERFFNNYYDISPEVPTPRARWKVLFPSQISSENQIHRNPIGAPAELWSNSSTLADSNHFSQVRMAANRIFWTGIDLNTQERSIAGKANATQFVVGHLNASFRLFVNGHLRFSGDGRDYLPIMISLAPLDLENETKVEIEVTQNLDSARPIVVDSPVTNGLFTVEKVRSLRDRWIFLLVMRPLAFGLAALLSCIAFTSLWLSVRDRNEYFLFGMYTLCLFAIQMTYLGAVKHGLHRAVAYQLDTALFIIEGTLAAMIGLSYARVRVLAYVVVLFIASIFTVVVLRSAQSGSDYLFLGQFIAKYFVPSCFLLGSIACISQASFGRAYKFSGMPKQKLERRIGRLQAFAYLNGFLGLVYVFSAQNIVTVDAFAVWHRPVQYLIVTLMGFFLFRDYREFDVFQQKVATSKFHDPLAIEQKIVTGYLLALDLKKSSALYDLSAQLALPKKIPTQWCELATEIVELKGGAKLSSAGDSLIAFFEGDGEEELASAVSSLLAIQRLSGEFSQYSTNVFFRGGITKASIRPIYKKVSRKLYEDYEDGPGETCFKNLMRIMDTEKDLGAEQQSILVVEKSISPIVAKFAALTKKKKLLVRDVGEKELHYFDLAVAGREETSEAA